MYTIFQGGSNTSHPTGFRMVRSKGNPHYVLLIIKSNSRFVLQDQTYDITPGTAIILDKETPYSYENPQGIYIDDWLHFDLSLDSALPLPVNAFFPIANTSHLTAYLKQLLYELHYAPDSYKAKNIDCLMTVLIHNLAHAYNDRHHYSKSSFYHEKLKELRLSLQHNPGENPSIADIAHKFRISVSHFAHLYSQLFGVSFQKDLIQMKIDFALDLLSHTTLTVEEIANLCGYNNTVHFHRQFKQITGMTPGKCRD